MNFPGRGRNIQNGTCWAGDTSCRTERLVYDLRRLRPNGHRCLRGDDRDLHVLAGRDPPINDDRKRGRRHEHLNVPLWLRGRADQRHDGRRYDRAAATTASYLITAGREARTLQPGTTTGGSGVVDAVAGLVTVGALASAAGTTVEDATQDAKDFLANPVEDTGVTNAASDQPDYRYLQSEEEIPRTRR